MTELSFIVHVEGAEKPTQHFGAYADARRHAQQLVDGSQADVAKVYAVPFRETAAAVSAHRAGNHTLLGVVQPPVSEREVQVARERAWEETEKLGPDAILEWLMKDFDFGKFDRR